MDLYWKIDCTCLFLNCFQSILTFFVFLLTFACSHLLRQLVRLKQVQTQQLHLQACTQVLLRVVDINPIKCVGWPCLKVLPDSVSKMTDYFRIFTTLYDIYRAKFVFGGLFFGLSQYLLLPKLPQKNTGFKSGHIHTKKSSRLINLNPWRNLCEIIHEIFFLLFWSDPYSRSRYGNEVINFYWTFIWCFIGSYNDL